jgi:ATP-dependent helicase HrpA
MVVRRTAGTAGNPAGQANVDRLSRIGRQEDALRSGSVRRSGRSRARASHRPAPLLALQLKEQLKFLEKNIPVCSRWACNSWRLVRRKNCATRSSNAGLERACLQEPLPKNAEQFNARKDEGKSRLGLLVNEIARLTGTVLTEYPRLPKKLQTVKAHTQAVNDMQTQLQGLIGKRFIADTDYTHLTHFPRYLKAINVRIDKLRADPTRDARAMTEWQQAAAPWQRALKERHGDPKMMEFRWLLEELRVSLYAQELRTPMPVSAKRLQKVWETMQR